MFVSFFRIFASFLSFFLTVSKKLAFVFFRLHLVGRPPPFPCLRSRSLCLGARSLHLPGPQTHSHTHTEHTETHTHSYPFASLNHLTYHTGAYLDSRNTQEINKQILRPLLRATLVASLATPTTTTSFHIHIASWQHNHSIQFINHLLSFPDSWMELS